MQLTHTLKQPTNGHHVWLSYVLICVRNYFFVLYLLFFGISAPSLFAFLCFISFFSMCWKSLNLQSLLWSAPVRCLRGDLAHSAPAAHSWAVRSQWWKWRRCLFSRGCASSNTSGSSICFLSERRHHCERWDHKVLHPPSDIRFIVCTHQFSWLCLLQEGGVSGFLHSFIAEVFAMVRAHVAALGGNAVVSYSMKECVFMENPNKNQVHTKHTFVYTCWPDLQCLISSHLTFSGLIFESFWLISPCRLSVLLMWVVTQSSVSEKQTRSTFSRRPAPVEPMGLRDPKNLLFLQCAQSEWTRSVETNISH